MPKDDFASLMEASLANKTSRTGRRLTKGENVEGTVIQISADSVFLDIGTTGDARIDRGELIDAKGELRVKLGDRLRATVIDTNPSQPQLAVTLGRGGDADISALKLAHESGVALEGRVGKSVKGGLEVELAGVRAFCPASHVELGYAGDLTVFEGQTLRFKVLEIRDGGRSVVLSRRAVLEDERRERQLGMLDQLVPGADLDGVVTSTSKHGAVVDLGGVEGFIHLSELARRRIERVEDVVQPGEKVRVRVLSADEGERGLKIRLSLKALAQGDATPAPAVDEVLEGKVSKVLASGLIVTTSKGDGLVPARELALAPGADHRRAFPVGKELKVVLLNRDGQGKLRFSLRGVAEVEERKNYQEFSGGNRSTHSAGGGLGSLGDLLRQKLGLPEPAPEPEPVAEPEPELVAAREAKPALAPERREPSNLPDVSPRAPVRAQRRPDPEGVVRRRKP